MTLGHPPMRLVGILGLVSIATILVSEVVVPQMAAGERVVHVRDEGVLRAYFDNEVLLAVTLAHVLVVLAYLGFVVGLARWPPLGVDGGYWRSLALVGTAVHVSLLVVRSGLHAALASTAALPAAPLAGLFAVYEYVYHGGAAALEALVVAVFSVAFWRSRATGRALPVFGFAVAAWQVANAASPWLGTPDAATLPGHLSFATWVTWTSVVALRATPGPRTTQPRAPEFRRAAP